jgi:hypothetical protein
MLDEQSLRRPGFAQGFPVTMADNQTWWLPRPRMIFRPTFIDGKVGIGGGATFGPEFEGDMAILRRDVAVEPEEYLRAKFAMAVQLLVLNYDLKPDDLEDLVVLEPDDPASVERWDVLSGAMMGIAPKTKDVTADV